MLIPISQLSQDDYLRAVLRGHLVAVDPDSGAQLSVSHGRTSKAPKYILILPNKTVAELAVGQKDAREYMRACWNGGRLTGQIDSGKVKADCGGVTDKAGEIIHEEREREYWDSKRQHNEMEAGS